MSTPVPHADTIADGLFTRAGYSDRHKHLLIKCDPPESWHPEKNPTQGRHFYVTPNRDWIVFRCCPLEGEAPPVTPALEEISLDFSCSIRYESSAVSRFIEGSPDEPGRMSCLIRIHEEKLAETGIVIPARRYPLVLRWFDSGSFEVWMPLIPILELLDAQPLEGIPDATSLPSKVDEATKSDGPVETTVPVPSGGGSGDPVGT